MHGQEIGLYYLQSRYYNAKVGRFLNADVVYDLDTGLQGYNLFVYCGNNPIRRVDISGADSVDLIDGEKDEDDPLVTEGGSGRGYRSSPPTGNPSGNGNTTNSSHIISLGNGTHIASSENTNAASTQQPTQYYNFQSEATLNQHFNKHNRQMGNPYSTPQEYLDDANYVIQNGEYLPAHNAYVRFYGLGGHANYAFVGLTSDGSHITTFHLKSAHKLF